MRLLLQLTLCLALVPLCLAPIAAQDWVITEVMGDPDPVMGDANGDGTIDTSEDEFVEILNASGSPQDISGWSVSDAVATRHVFPPGTVIENGCVVVVFGGGAVGLEFNGATMMVASEGFLGLNNGGDTVSLVNLDVEEVAFFAYPDGPPEGDDDENQSWVPDPEFPDSVILHSEAPGSGGALFSVGTLTDGTRYEGCPDEPPPPPENTGILINEFLADPDAEAGDSNGDGVIDPSQDEFIEIYNARDEEVDLSNWSISDLVQIRHVFAAETILPPDCAILVFGGGSVQIVDTLDTCVPAQRASSGLLGFNNGGDTITIADSSGIQQATVTYGSEGGDNQSITLSPDLDAEGTYVKHGEAPESDGAIFSPGRLSDGTAFNGCPEECPPEVVTEIWEIQGPAGASPFAGVSVITRDNVVTALVNNGFFMQTPTERSDNDPETSDGLFVFTGGAPNVAVGDFVDVEGEVIEFFDLTEISRPDLVVVTSSDNPVPPPVVFDETLPSPDQPVPPNELERLEGLIVTLTNGTVCGYDGFGDMSAVATSTRAFREPGIEYPGLDGLPVWDGNPEIFEIRDDEAGLPDVEPSAGSRIVECTGPFSYRFGEYSILPTVFEFEEALPEPRAVRARRAGEFTIATQNLEGLFDNVDDPGNDEVLETAEYQRRLAKLSRHIVDVLGAPDILAVQEVESETVLRALADAVTAFDGSVSYTALFEFGNDPFLLNLGFLVRDTVQVDSVDQIGLEERIPELDQLVFVRAPYVLEATYIGAEEPLPLTVINVHNRSLNNVGEFDDSGELARARRFEEAKFLANFVQDRQAADPETRAVIIGDFNAYEFSDGFVDVMGIITGDPEDVVNVVESVDLVDPDLENLVLRLPPEERYSFVFRGSAQVLDSAVTTSALSAIVSDVAYARGNADTGDVVAEDNSTALGASDHDGFVVYITAGEGPQGVAFIRADSNADGSVNLSDGVNTLNVLFQGTGNISCQEAADSNADGTVNLSDAVNTFNVLFLGTGSIPAPNACGEGTVEEERCAAFRPCAR